MRWDRSVLVYYTFLCLKKRILKIVLQNKGDYTTSSVTMLNKYFDSKGPVSHNKTINEPAASIKKDV